MFRRPSAPCLVHLSTVFFMTIDCLFVYIMYRGGLVWAVVLPGGFLLGEGVWLSELLFISEY